MYPGQQQNVGPPARGQNMYSRPHFQAAPQHFPMQYAPPNGQRVAYISAVPQHPHPQQHVHPHPQALPHQQAHTHPPQVMQSMYPAYPQPMMSAGFQIIRPPFAEGAAQYPMPLFTRLANGQYVPIQMLQPNQIIDVQHTSAMQLLPPQPMEQYQEEANSLALREALAVISMEEKGKAKSVNQGQDNNTLLERAQKKSTDDDDTAPGTPQPLEPMTDQQVDLLLSTLKEEEKGGKSEGVSQEEQDRKAMPPPKHHHTKRPQKPEQQHYQPPRAGRPQARRTDSWRGGSHPAAPLSKINEEGQANGSKERSMPPPPLPPSSSSSLRGKQSSEETVDSNRTPRASPTPSQRSSAAPSERSSIVPTIGGVPLVVPSTKEKQSVVKPSEEHCSYCDMQKKSLRIVRSHSLFSSRGFPACPYFRDDGCKLCGAKGDNAHLPEFCHKFQRNKENSEFKSMANYLFSMSDDERKEILLKPSAAQVTFNNREVDEMQQAAQKRVFFKYNRMAEEEQKAVNEGRICFDQPRSGYHDERGYRGGRPGSSGPRNRGGADYSKGRGGGGGSGGGGRGAGAGFSSRSGRRFDSRRGGAPRNMR